MLNGEKNLKPALLAKYPASTPAELKKAHAYAYGGCLMPDMGYMPFGNPYFTDLLHYVRTGDFVSELINESKNINQYAFALGALSHYMADEYGHSLATNKTVPIIFPDLQKKFGNTITYGDDHTSHSRTEFGYDVIQTAQGHYATIAYHDFIGFSMDSTLLANAFMKIYGEQLSVVFPDYSSTINTFRWGVRDMFPAIIHRAWHLKKNEIIANNHSASRSRFRYHMSRRTFNKEFGDNYTKPSFKARVIAFILEILPKIGPLRRLKFKDPGPEGEKLFNASIDSILVHYTLALQQVSHHKAALKNIDYDTGMPTTIHEYELTDKTYGQWLQSLQKQNFINADDALKQNLATYYGKTDTVGLSKFTPQATAAK
jgi:Zinc dependent phospholipase C